MPRKKQAEFNDEPQEEFEWDKPRIIIFFAVIFALLIGGLLYKHFVLDAQATPSATISRSVQGASSLPPTNSSQLPSVESIKQSAGQEIQTLQNQASQISIQQIASSSPQVQQIIQQLQQLPSQPGNIAKQTCENICNSL